MKYPFLKGNLAKKIINNLSVTSGDKCQSYSTVKNWVARFGTGHLSTEDEYSGRPTQVTIPENVDTVHSMILDNREYPVRRHKRPLQYLEKK
jgi:transposase